MVLIGLRLSYFEGIYNSIATLRDRSFLLLKTDGTILVRYPDAIDRSNQKMPAGSPWYKLVETGGGHYGSPGYFDDQARLVSVQPLREYPLVINVAVSKSAALAIWRWRATLNSHRNVARIDFLCVSIANLEESNFIDFSDPKPRLPNVRQVWPRRRSNCGTQMSMLMPRCTTCPRGFACSMRRVASSSITSVSPRGWECRMPRSGAGPCSMIKFQKWSGEFPGDPQEFFARVVAEPGR